MTEDFHYRLEDRDALTKLTTARGKWSQDSC
jgi:hypothetical protein